jgi:hypothetical protein
VGKIASTPEFIFSSPSCPNANCLDLDKTLVLKERDSYQNFWNLDFLQITKLYPESEKVECTKSNYPDCTTITIIPKENFGVPSGAFVSLCYWENSKGGYTKCEVGKIYATGKDIK